MGSFEVIEHTADVGLRVEAAQLDELFATAAQGLFSLIVDNPQAIEPRETVRFELDAEDREGLFVDWLRELIYRFETEQWLFCKFQIELADGDRRMRADCRGERADWSRHQPDNELKAVTYHGLRVAPVPSGWEAEVIFDI